MDRLEHSRRYIDALLNRDAQYWNEKESKTQLIMDTLWILFLLSSWERELCIFP